jgi:hypothetical protein
MCADVRGLVLLTREINFANMRFHVFDRWSLSDDDDSDISPVVVTSQV